MASLNDNITYKKVLEWFDEVDAALAEQMVNTPLEATDVRENLYYLCHSTRLLKARLHSELFETVEVKTNMYDE